MSSYDLIVFLHVLAAASWVGAALASLLLVELSMRADDRTWLLRFSQFQERLAQLLFIPASFVTLLSGITLVWRGGYELSAGWVGAGLGAWLVLFVVGITLFAPAGRKLQAVIDEHGLDSPEVLTQLTFVRNVQRADFLLLVGVIFVMTTKAF